MINIFSELKNMNHHLSNALSTILLRRLDIFLPFETYVLENPQNPWSSIFPVYQLDFLPHIYSYHIPSFHTLPVFQTEKDTPPFPPFKQNLPFKPNECSEAKLPRNFSFMVS